MSPSPNTAALTKVVSVIAELFQNFASDHHIMTLRRRIQEAEDGVGMLSKGFGLL